MDGIFVTGIDTGVGKTTLCAGLMKALQGSRKAFYFKPVQTGTIIGDDTQEVRRLTDIPVDQFIDPVYRFPDPLSPHWAAKRWGKTIDMNTILNSYEQAKRKGFLVVEGAGGVLVPLNSEQLQIELMKLMGLGLIIVSEDRVGSINQTLLTLNAVREKGIPLLGVVLMRSRRNLGNAEAITHFGHVEILAEFDPTDDAKMLIARVGAHPRLRQLLAVDSLPN